MAVYVFSTDSGTIVERIYPMGECPELVRVNGSVAYRNRTLENVHTVIKRGRGRVRSGHGKWPMEPCVASGVQPDQAQELRDFYKSRGLSVEVNNDGDPIYTSAEQRRKALKARGMFDKASYN